MQSSAPMQRCDPMPDSQSTTETSFVAEWTPTPEDPKSWRSVIASFETPEAAEETITDLGHPEFHYRVIERTVTAKIIKTVAPRVCPAP